MIFIHTKEAIIITSKPTSSKISSFFGVLTLPPLSLWFCCMSVVHCHKLLIIHEHRGEIVTSNLFQNKTSKTESYTSVSKSTPDENSCSTPAWISGKESTCFALLSHHSHQIWILLIFMMKKRKMWKLVYQRNTLTFTLDYKKSAEMGRALK